METMERVRSRTGKGRRASGKDYLQEYTLDEVVTQIYGERGTETRESFEMGQAVEVGSYMLGIRIKELREKAGLRQEELGERMGVSKSMVCKIERGTGITYNTMARAFRALGATEFRISLGAVGEIELEI